METTLKLGQNKKKYMPNSNNINTCQYEYKLWTAQANTGYIFEAQKAKP